MSFQAVHPLKKSNSLEARKPVPRQSLNSNEYLKTATDPFVVCSTCKIAAMPTFFPMRSEACKINYSDAQICMRACTYVAACWLVMCELARGCGDQRQQPILMMCTVQCRLACNTIPACVRSIWQHLHCRRLSILAGGQLHTASCKRQRYSGGCPG